MQIFAKSDIGRERKLNEDSYYSSKPEDKLKLFILADGMGGYNGGEVASSLAVEAVRKYIEKNYSEEIKDDETLVRLLCEAEKYANNVVRRKSMDNKELAEMGTTLDTVLIKDNKMYVSHVGDSRIYRIRKSYMRKISKDHSYVEKLVEDGKISKSEAQHHPKKNMLIKAIGTTDELEPDGYVKTFLKDDILLMCSDGLTNMIKEDEILNIIKDDINTAVENLVEKANDNGGFDNITVIIVK